MSRKFAVIKNTVEPGEHGLFDIVLPPEAKKISGVMVKAHNRDHVTVTEQKTEYPEYTGPNYGTGGEIYATSQEKTPGNINEKLRIVQNFPGYVYDMYDELGETMANVILDFWETLSGADKNKQKLKYAALNYRTEIINEITLYLGSPIVGNHAFVVDWLNSGTFTLEQVERGFDKNRTSPYYYYYGIPEEVKRMFSNAFINLFNDQTLPEDYSAYLDDKNVYPDIRNIPNPIKTYAEVASDLGKSIEDQLLVPFLREIRDSGYFSKEVYISESYARKINWKQELIDLAIGSHENIFFYFDAVDEWLADIVGYAISLNPEITPAEVLYHQEIVGEFSMLTNSGYEIVLRDYPVQINDNKVVIRTDLIDVDEPVYVGSQAKIVFKNNKNFMDAINLDLYFEYEN